MQEKSKIFTIIKIVLFVMSVFLMTLGILLMAYQLRFISGLANCIFIGISIVILGVWVSIIIRYKLRKTKFARLVIFLSVIIAVVSMPFIMFLLSSDRTVCYTESSPFGKNKIVVFESGFIDAVYMAYPVKYGIFYQKQDNGYITKHDFWGGANIEVEWISENEACVKVITDYMNPDDMVTESDNILEVVF